MRTIYTNILYWYKSVIVVLSSSELNEKKKRSFEIVDIDKAKIKIVPNYFSSFKKNIWKII